jgi:NitT/TauT family transport system substrate-binding protein
MKPKRFSMQQLMQQAMRPLSALLSVLALCAIVDVTPTAAQAPEAVTLRLDWSVLSYHTPFYLAAARGYYRDAGLTVSIQEGKGSSGTVQLVGNGADTFGLADGAVVAKAISTGVPVKMVMGILKNSPMALVYTGDSGIRTPQDLRGKRISTCAGQSTGVLLPAYLTAVGVPLDAVQVINTQCGPPIYQAVAQHQAEAAASYAPPGKTYLTALGVKDIRAFEFSDAGILLPAHGILTSLKMIETKPDTVRRFVAATAKGWHAAQESPNAAIEAAVAALPLLKGREGEMRGDFEDYLKYIDTPNTKGKPFGWQSADDWRKAEATLAQYMDLKLQPSVDVYFTNDFLPK